MLNPNNHNQQENIGKHHELTQHSLFNTHIQQLFIIHPQIQSILLRMMHAPNLNSQMQCGTYHQPRKQPKRVHTTPHLGKLCSNCRGHPAVHRNSLVQSTYCHSLYHFLCHMRHETWASSSTMTMDELKILSHPLRDT